LLSAFSDNRPRHSFTRIGRKNRNGWVSIDGEREYNDEAVGEGESKTDAGLDDDETKPGYQLTLLFSCFELDRLT
jgi:hypothetical protein